MIAALLIARVELKRRIRNRSAIVTAFVGPLVLAIVFGVLLGGTRNVSFTLGVIDLDRSVVTIDFSSALLANDTASPVRFESRPSAEAARQAVDDGTLDAAIVIPSGFGAAVLAGSAADVTVLRNPAKQISGDVAESIAKQFTAAISSRTLAVATATALGSSAQLSTFTDRISGEIADQPPGGRQLDPASFFGVTMSILFLFFTVSFAARSLIAERRSGVLPRMLATATSPASIVVGKVLAVSVLGLLGFGTVWGVTSLAFGAPWGDPVAVVVAMIATVLAVGGVATFVCGLARTQQQADTYTAALAFVLALLGGNFIGPGQAPRALQNVAQFTPNGQAINAFTKIAVDGAGVGGIAGQLVVLATIAIVFGSIGLWRIGSVIRP